LWLIGSLIKDLSEYFLRLCEVCNKLATLGVELIELDGAVQAPFSSLSCVKPSKYKAATLLSSSSLSLRFYCMFNAFSVTLGSSSLAECAAFMPLSAGYKMCPGGILTVTG
jgi:hypothetical protein